MGRNGRISWDDFLLDRGPNKGMIPVRVNAARLNSDEAIIATLAHEMYEINKLRGMFEGALP